MSFLEHLEELRWRLVKSAIAIVAFATVMWIYKGWILDKLFLSMRFTNFPTFKLMCNWFDVCVESIKIEMQSTSMAGQFSYAIMMSIMGGIVLAFPFIFYQLWSFVKPGLKQNEKGAAKGIVFWVSLLFFIGIMFGYFIVAPLCVQFFGNFQISTAVKNDFTIDSYMGMVLSTVFYTGLLFLLPVVTYIFTKLGVITPEYLIKYRKHAIVGILILAAFITPPDLISQVIVGVPIILLYEIGILVSKRVQRRKKKQEMNQQ